MEESTLRDCKSSKDTAKDCVGPEDMPSKPHLFEDWLLETGDFGLYQKFVCTLLCLVAIPGVFNNIGYVYWAARPAHWCKVPSLDSLNLTQSEKINISVPWHYDTEGRPQLSKCFIFDRDYANLTDVDARRILEETEEATGNRTKQISCSEWTYDQSTYRSTIVTDYNLVCDSAWLISTSQSIYMMGRVIASILFGHLADKYGRRPVIVTCTVLEVIGAVFSAFCPEIFSFIVMRFLLAMAETGQFQTAFVIMIELVGPTWRVFMGNFIMFFWAFGYLLTVAIAYLIRDRLPLMLLTSAPCALLFIYVWAIPESPRWLLVSGRVPEAHKVMRRIASVNGAELGLEDHVTSVSTGNSETMDQKDPSILDLMRKPNMRTKSLIQFYSW